VCGRYVSAAPVDDLAKYFSTAVPEHTLEANYNVAPTTEVYAVRANEGERALASMRWGLVPFWAKDLKIGSKMINARSETAPGKPAFRRAFTKRRCLLPADGFYEWQKIEGQKTKQPYFIHRADDEPLVFAGLYEFWHPKDADGNDLEDTDLVVSCTILTTSANETMRPVHDRMPVMLAPRVWDDWLDPAADLDFVTSLMVPAPESLLTMYPVTTAVNSVRNQGAELLEPVNRLDLHA
jgi:putative SOS response-associated peptidase YedK